MLLFFAIGLGWVSIEATESESISRYRNTHWPIRSLWSGLLRDHGLIQRTDLNPFLKFLETHPHAFSNDSNFWVTSEGCVTYLPQAPNQNKPELWTCSELPKSPEWINLGSGLNGFEKLGAFLEKTPRKSAPKAKFRSKEIDPKEFHY